MQTTSVETNIFDYIPRSYKGLEEYFKFLVEMKNKNANYSAFVPLQLHIRDSSLEKIIEILSTEWGELGIKQFRITEDILDIFPETGKFLTSEKFIVGTFLIPRKLIKLMIQLADTKQEDEIYCPYDSLGKFALQIIEQKGHPYLEISGNIPIIYLINILNEVDIKVSYSHPVYNPSYMESGERKAFAKSICILPTGIKYDKKLINESLENFPLPLISWIHSDAYALECLLAQTKNSAVVVVNNTLLFSMNSQKFRQSLVERNIIETIIFLSSDIFPYALPHFSIVVFNKNKGDDNNIRFIDGTHKDFWKQVNRLSELVESESLSKISPSKIDEFIVIDVSKEKILANQSSLEINQYIYSSEEKKVEELFSKIITTPLAQVVKIIPPVSSIHIYYHPSDKVQAKEITIDNFADYGYLSSPTKEVDTINYKQNEHFLQPYDIVIVTKGSVGKVGITPPDVPEIGKGGWVVNQSYSILRTRKKISAISLYMYLISEVGQTAILRLISKATRPLIRQAELKQLPIIIPTTEQAQEIEKTFYRMVKINCLKSKLTEKQNELHKKYWSLSNYEK